MASLLFRDAIDYSRVRIHGRRYMPFQPKNCCMTPNGSMYFHRSCFLPDYSRGDPGAIHWFMHEMVHVWQHQAGHWLPIERHPFCRYGYTLEPGKPFARYGIEQQAEIVRHAFLAREQGSDAGPLAAILPFSPA